MIASWDPKPHPIFVALLCAYVLITPNAALATSLLTADAVGNVSAGLTIGTPTKLITPGDGSLAVTYGATASHSFPGIGLSASLLGSGEARYGALAGRARAEAASAPPSPFVVGGEIVLSLGFLDTAEVVSSTLAPGTPVTLTFRMTLEAAAIHGANGLFTPLRIVAGIRSDARIFDIEAGTSTPSFPASPHTIVNSIGDSITLTTFEFDTAIGHHLQIDVDMIGGARAIIDPAVFLGQASTGSAEVVADDTAHFFYQPSGDVRLVSESGHDYAVGAVPGPVPGPGPGGGTVPEPASLALFCVGAAGILVATRRPSRVIDALSRGRRSSFVVRVVEGRRGQVRGVIERVATGSKEAFADLEAVGRVIREMLRDTRPRARAGLGPSRTSPDETSRLPECPPDGSIQREGRRR